MKERTTMKVYIVIWGTVNSREYTIEGSFFKTEDAERRAEEVRNYPNFDKTYDFATVTYLEVE